MSGDSIAVATKSFFMNPWMFAIVALCALFAAAVSIWTIIKVAPAAGIDTSRGGTTIVQSALTDPVEATYVADASDLPSQTITVPFQAVDATGAVVAFTVTNPVILYTSVTDTIMGDSVSYSIDSSKFPVGTAVSSFDLVIQDRSSVLGKFIGTKAIGTYSSKRTKKTVVAEWIPASGSARPAVFTVQENGRPALFLGKGQSEAPMAFMEPFYPWEDSSIVPTLDLYDMYIDNDNKIAHFCCMYNTLIYYCSYGFQAILDVLADPDRVYPDVDADKDVKRFTGTTMGADSAPTFLRFNKQFTSKLAIWFQDIADTGLIVVTKPGLNYVYCTSDDSLSPGQTFVVDAALVAATYTSVDVAFGVNGSSNGRPVYTFIGTGDVYWNMVTAENTTAYTVTLQTASVGLKVLDSSGGTALVPKIRFRTVPKASADDDGDDIPNVPHIFYYDSADNRVKVIWADNLAGSAWDTAQNYTLPLADVADSSLTHNVNYDVVCIDGKFTVVMGDSNGRYLMVSQQAAKAVIKGTGLAFPRPKKIDPSQQNDAYLMTTTETLADSDPIKCGVIDGKLAFQYVLVTSAPVRPLFVQCADDGIVNRYNVSYTVRGSA